MTEEEKERYSNRGWLSSINHRPKNIAKVNDFALDRLKKLEYVEVIGSFVAITDKGKKYLESIKGK